MLRQYADHRKHRYELVDKPEKESNRIFINKELALKIIIDCRTTVAHKFRTRLGCKQYDVILTKEHSVLKKIKSSFEGENMQTQYSVLGYRVDLYIHGLIIYSIEIDENGHSDRNIDYEIKRQKATEQELGCKCSRIDPDEEEFDTFKVVNEIFRHIKQSTKRTLIYRISMRLLGLEFKSNNTIKSKARKYFVKKNIAQL